MMRSLYSGITGLRNHQTRMDVVGNNISNVNTVGFKASRVIFQDIFSQTTKTASAANEGTTGGTNPQQIGLGMTLSTIDVLHTRSASQYTGNTLDLMIDGDGFFVVQGATGEPLYTRAGNFYVDEVHQLTTGEGLLVQGYQYTPVYTWKLDATYVTRAAGDAYDGALRNGVIIPTTTDGTTGWPLTVDNTGTAVTSPPAGTLTYSYTDATQDPPVLVENVPISIIVRDKGLKLDSMGQPVLEAARDEKGNVIRVGGTKKLVNGVEVFEGGTEIMVPVFEGDVVKHDKTGQDARVFVMVDTDGNIDLGSQEATDENKARIPVHARDENNELMYNTAAQRDGIVIDPRYYNIAIDQGGIITGIDRNSGTITKIGQLELATFANQAGLEKRGTNLYAATTNSGEAAYGAPNVNGAGKINPGSLEMSNVDLASEFTDMIVTQRGFQANSRIITTSDSMLEELVNLKR